MSEFAVDLRAARRGLALRRLLPPVPLRRGRGGGGACLELLLELAVEERGGVGLASMAEVVGTCWSERVCI